MNIDNIKKYISKFKTRNPFDIAESLNIIVLFEDLGTINGYFNVAYRQKFIHINQNLDENKQLFTIAHELGHAILHPKSNTAFLREHTLFSIDKLEVEANKFAAELLIDDEELKTCIENGYTVEQIAAYFQVLPELVKYKNLNKK
ncbi:ImmA/IrrE family metallo-endopeptidase [Intestinibacter sp.]|uniref:ImmA/IrrE family metallo-endopeptidase n=1 Tax=Intestinibacter sp. TaxID=1965304 RepID=UPI002A74D28C|nr:ImmA/IrrE family metallo-endopeptidase [Intestinibacter sp.]MDY2734713.1 ImmA/IrrE family metallo-endopeptidase [Intestinibacter sp.]